MGTLFDISQFKWAESVQARRVSEALEAKRQQEKYFAYILWFVLCILLTNNSFIDMTSHELRNPLSAVVQCAESVITTLQCFPHQSSPTAPTQVEWSKLQEDIHTSIEALQTIVSCSLHQKRVIDDVLTLSKLDSNLILITPIRVQPTVVVSDAMKMFLVECQQMDIQLEFVEDKSIDELDWVLLDPSRLLQVLINLL
jgi:signal transduction histidine kinase